MKALVSRRYWIGIAVCLLMLCGPTTLFAQWQSPQSFYPNYSNYTVAMPNQLWDDRVLQKQLELTKQQRRQLIEIKIDYDDVVGDLQLKIKELNGKQYTYGTNGSYQVNKEVQQQLRDLRKQITAVNRDFLDKADDVLLPHQRKIRGQVRLKRNLKSRGFIQQLSSGGLDQYLDISPDQKARIVAKKKEIDERLKKEIAKLLRNAKNEIVRELEESQRKRVREIFEDYEYRADRSTISILQYELYYLKPRKTEKR